MRSAFDFAPFRRSTIGFDRLFDLLENSAVGNGGENYPPFDLVKVGDNEYRIDIAVAGFGSEDIDITAQQNQLVVTGKYSTGQLRDLTSTVTYEVAPEGIVTVDTTGLVNGP